MAPTSDERREVAESIRHYAEESCASAYEFIRGYWPNDLADLIDPTCHIVCVDDTYNTPETGRVDEWHYKCGKCGIELDDNDTDAMDSGVKPFDYCPNCGARVMS